MSGFPALRLRRAGGLLDLPWELPLDSWPTTLKFRDLPVGPSRHLVRFLVLNGVLYALKDLPLEAARREYEVLLEPDTEGRLAASLARHGEGFTAIWFGRRAGAPDDLPEGFGPPADGPLGPARLLLGGPPWGLNVLLLEADAT